MQADGYPALCLTSQFSIRFAERNYVFDIAPRIEDLNLALVKMKCWEIIAQQSRLELGLCLSDRFSRANNLDC
jgi:hypothetical protein